MAAARSAAQRAAARANLAKARAARKMGHTASGEPGRVVRIKDGAARRLMVANIKQSKVPNSSNLANAKSRLTRADAINKTYRLPRWK